MDIIGYITDKNREEIVKSNLGEDNFLNLKEKLNSAFDSFAESIDAEVVEYLKLILRLSQRIPVTEILELPKYNNSHRTVVLVTDENYEASIADIKKHKELGFDTESQPTFKKGQKNNIVSLIQIATNDCCYIFKMSLISDYTPLGEILADSTSKKIGVSLYGDKDRLQADYDFELNGIVSVDEVFKKIGSKDIVGAKQMVALVLHSNIEKSKNMSRSNWAAKKLTPKQLIYASDDAFSALDVYFKLQELFAEYKKVVPKRVFVLLDLKK